MTTTTMKYAPRRSGKTYKVAQALVDYLKVNYPERQAVIMAPTLALGANVAHTAVQIAGEGRWEYLKESGCIRDSWTKTVVAIVDLSRGNYDKKHWGCFGDELPPEQVRELEKQPWEEAFLVQGW